MSDVGPWTMVERLRPWQVEALDSWNAAGHRGVIEAATGTGKTFVALAAIQNAVAEFGSKARVVVVVSSLELARQWRADLVNTLGVPEHEITEWHSEAPQPPSSPKRLVLAVIDTARRRLPDTMTSWHQDQLETLLIVDECHHSASPTSRRIFDVPARRSMRLSATLERQDGYEHVVYDGVGEICYTYSLLDALDAGVLAPITSVNVYVEFTPSERDEWAVLGATVESLMGRLRGKQVATGASNARLDLREIKQLATTGDLDAQRVLSTITKRSRLLKGASNRARCVEAISKWLAQTSFSILVFHESIIEAERSHATFLAAGLTASLEHSSLDPSDRRKAADAFRAGECRVWVVVRAADEGVDVPDASCAVIVACTGSERQRVQRFGRILRHQEGKRALAISVLVRATPEEDRVGLRDEELLGSQRVRHHRWEPGSPIDTLLDGSMSSSYQPTRSTDRSVADRLVGQELQLIDPAGGQSTSPFDSIPVADRKSLYRLDEAARFVGKNPAWIRNNLSRLQGGGEPDEDIQVRRTEIEFLFDRVMREKAKQAAATQPVKARPSKRRQIVTRERILDIAKRLESNSRPLIARDLGVDVSELDRFLRSDPMLAFKLRQLRGHGSSGAA